MTALLTRLQLTVALALLVFAALLSGCALCAQAGAKEGRGMTNDELRLAIGTPQP